MNTFVIAWIILSIVCGLDLLRLALQGKLNWSNWNPGERVGVDVEIIVQPCTAEERAVFRSTLSFDEHAAGTFDSEDRMVVCLFIRYWCPDLGSGYWPQIEDLLKTTVAAFPNAEVRYRSDCGDADSDYGELVTPQMLLDYRKAWDARNLK